MLWPSSFACAETPQSAISRSIATNSASTDASTMIPIVTPPSLR